MLINRRIPLKIFIILTSCIPSSLSTNVGRVFTTILAPSSSTNSPLTETSKSLRASLLSSGYLEAPFSSVMSSSSHVNCLGAKGGVIYKSIIVQFITSNIFENWKL